MSRHYVVDLIFKFSFFFFSPCRSLAYFKTVRILLPPSWMNGTDVATATWERYATSDVRIAPANENFPYTEKFTGCGLPGRFISLTPGYISNRKVGLDALHDIYGTPNKVGAIIVFKRIDHPITIELNFNESKKNMQESDR